MKNTFILLLLSSFIAAGQNQTESLPKPTGNYLVGVTYLGFVDTTRKELFDNHQQKNREIAVKAWYPSDSKTDFVLETGIKFRALLSHTPLKFMTKLTDFWGVRFGVKNKGFFDINSLQYVVEIGAGTW